MREHGAKICSGLPYSGDFPRLDTISHVGVALTFLPLCLAKAVIQSSSPACFCSHVERTQLRGVGQPWLSGACRQNSFDAQVCME
mmetsp:Transcript_20092/g.60159  ORF Transcript_20092/g.60159 Transcript_20092/m.60159 type:complete len:85 (-) Transcript_20092:76-330(-)